MTIRLNRIYAVLIFAICILLIIGALILSNGIIITDNFPYIIRQFNKIDFKMFGAILGVYSFVFTQVKFVLSNFKRITGLNVKAKKTQTDELIEIDMQIINHFYKDVTIKSFILDGYTIENENDIIEINSDGKIKILIKFRENNEQTINSDGTNTLVLKIFYEKDNSNKTLTKKIKL